MSLGWTNMTCLKATILTSRLSTVFVTKLLVETHVLCKFWVVCGPFNKLTLWKEQMHLTSDNAFVQSTSLQVYLSFVTALNLTFLTCNQRRWGAQMLWILVSVELTMWLMLAGPYTRMLRTRAANLAGSKCTSSLAWTTAYSGASRSTHIWYTVSYFTFPIS